MNREKIALIAIIFVGLSVRLWRLSIPLLEFYPTRQVQTAEITRNLYFDNNILQPSVNYFGPGHTVFALEFPIYNFVVSVLYKMFGGPNEILGRLFSISGWLLVCYFLYKITRKYFDTT